MRLLDLSFESHRSPLKELQKLWTHLTCLEMLRSHLSFSISFFE